MSTCVKTCYRKEKNDKMMHMQKSEEPRLFKTGELVIMTAGILFLLSVAVMWVFGNVALWFAAAFLYAIGTIMFVFNT